jgi:hypothetical protein
MKPRNWRTYYGYRREPLSYPPKDPVAMERAYLAWLASSGRVTVDDHAMAVIEDHRRETLGYCKRAVIRDQAALAAANLTKNSYRRRKARLALRAAEDDLARAETSLADEESMRAEALEFALAQYVSDQYQEPAVVCRILNEYDTACERSYTTDREFRKAISQVEMFP